MEEKSVVLHVEHLSAAFTQYERGFRQTEIMPIRDLNLTVKEGEVVAVVGASGSGKSLLAHAVLGILPYNASLSGQIWYDGAPLTKERQKAVRGREIALVPQSVSYLDPLMKAGNQIRKGGRDPESRRRCGSTLKRYGLGEETETLYPFELSGGMTRRVLISTAVMEQPKLVIADEPTPGLHVEAAKRVLSHFKELADDGAGVLIITHDLELALTVADRIVVFYAGMDVEEALAGDFSREELLRHPYTKALYRAMPEHGFFAESSTQPYVKEVPDGCPYAGSCSLAGEECLNDVPFQALRGGFVKCVKAT